MCTVLNVDGMPANMFQYEELLQKMTDKFASVIDE